MCDKNESEIEINMNTECIRYLDCGCYIYVNFSASVNIEQTGFDE